MGQAEATCKDCGFDWRVDRSDAINGVAGAPDRFASLFARGTSSRYPDPKHPDAWSATGYLWHVVDVLRYGTERLWTLTLDPESGVPGWDQEEMAKVRGYENLSPKVGIVALRAAASEWVRAAAAAPPEATVSHPSLGEITTSASIMRNAHEVRHHEADIRSALIP